MQAHPQRCADLRQAQVAFMVAGLAQADRWATIELDEHLQALALEYDVRNPAMQAVPLRPGGAIVE
ncbi:hypothetical protein D3C80_1650980 [compost metagenome]